MVRRFRQLATCARSNPERKRQENSAGRAQIDVHDHADKVPAEKVADIEGKVKSLRGAIEKEDHAAIQSGTEQLEKAMAELAQVAYGGAGGPGGPTGGGGPGAPGGGGAKKDGDVIDAEFEETN